MIQCVRHELNDEYSFAELAEMAGEVKPFKQFINVNDDRFTNPDSMIEEIKKYCRESNQVVPETPGELAMAIYSNLALYYASEIEELNKILGYKIQALNIVGGGSNVKLLNQLTSTLAGINVYAGPGEATAIGNILVQMITKKEIKNIVEGRKIIRDSYCVNTIEPENDKYDGILQKYQEFLETSERATV